MTSTIPNKDVPLYLGRTLEQWWADFLSANYVDDMKPACQELMGLDPFNVRWKYWESHSLADDNTNLVWQALPCFGDAFVRKVAETLPGLDEQRRSRAVFAIAKTGWSSVPFLAQLLEHPSANVRAAACLGLAEVAGPVERDEPWAIRKWKVEFLRGPRPSREEVEAFFDTMEALYDSADDKYPLDSNVPSALFKRLEDAYETVRVAAVAALKLLFHRCQVEVTITDKLSAALKARLEDEFQAVRLSAMAALDFLELESSPVGEQKSRIYDLLADPSTEEMAMRELVYNRVVEHLQRLLNDPSTDVHERVGRILALCGTGQDATNLGRRDILNLLGALQDADPVCGRNSVNRQEAVWALQWLADQWEDAKANQLDENEPESPQLHPPLLKSVSMHRHQLIQASLERLVTAMHDPDIAIRSAAVDALAENRNASPKAVEYVDKMLQDPCKQVRWRAERALNILVRDKSEAWERYGLDGRPVANKY